MESSCYPKSLYGNIIAIILIVIIELFYAQDTNLSYLILIKPQNYKFSHFTDETLRYRD